MVLPWFWGREELSNYVLPRVRRSGKNSTHPRRCPPNGGVAWIPKPLHGWTHELVWQYHRFRLVFRLGFFGVLSDLLVVVLCLISLVVAYGRTACRVIPVCYDFMGRKGLGLLPCGMKFSCISSGASPHSCSFLLHTKFSLYLLPQVCQVPGPMVSRK